jgi:hypothetical protein
MRICSLKIGCRRIISNTAYVEFVIGFIKYKRYILLYLLFFFKGGCYGSGETGFDYEKNCYTTQNYSAAVFKDGSRHRGWCGTVVGAVEGE